MNGFTIPSTSVRVISIVVVAIAILTIMAVGTLAWCLINGKWSKGSLLTAFVALTGQLIGSLTGLLSNTRSQPGTDSEMAKATVVADKPTP